MPLYICNTTRDALDAAAREKLAIAITDIHCAVTDAPAMFVHVAFFEEAPQFPLDDSSLFVVGTIRRGRTDDQKDEIATSIKAALASTAGIDADRAAVLIRETPASWVLEGGEIMPEPGEEAAWLAEHGARRARESS